MIGWRRQDKDAETESDSLLSWVGGGASNPLWLILGAAAGAGAAWWLVSRVLRGGGDLRAPPQIATAPDQDDLTRISGLAPKIAAALAARGVTRFEHLAAWSPEEMAGFDVAMKLKGRSLREGWIEQAQKLADARL